MSGSDWTLTGNERATLGAALDALLPPDGSFPTPSETGLIDDFILQRVPADGGSHVPYPGIHAGDLKVILATLAGREDMTSALEELEREQPVYFRALWALAVYGYYSRPETVAAIQADLAPEYHGAPLPVGYAHVIEPWNPDDPLQLPRQPRGGYIPTDRVRRVDLSRLDFEQTGEES